MRGKVSTIEQNAPAIGITPAYAGKSAYAKKYKCIMQDHPRLCGEKFHNFIFHKLFIGSPPPMRGKVQIFLSASFDMGITPAYAGKR